MVDPAGKEVAAGRSVAVNIDPLEQGEARLSIAVTSPQLWSVDHADPVRSADNGA